MFSPEVLSLRKMKNIQSRKQTAQLENQKPQKGVDALWTRPAKCGMLWYVAGYC